MKHKKDVILLSTSCIQSQLMRNFLSDLLQTEIKLETEQSLTLTERNNAIVLLVDFSNLPDSDIAWEVQLQNYEKKVHTVILNTPEDITPQALLKWPNICGYFSHCEEQETLITGLKSILNGEYWIPHSMLVEMIIYLQTISKDTISNIDLTCREIDVLHHLCNDKNNTEIANLLFLSEHTVKSHLYKAYKKINVKNRSQAKQWAQCHLKRCIK